MEHFGWISMIPALCVLVFALITKRTIESLVFGALVGFIIVYKGSFFTEFMNSALDVMADPTIGWIILVIMLFGGLISLLVKSGGSFAFGEFVSSRVKTKRGSLLTTFLMGIVIFMDDYLNALTVSTSMQKVTDKHRTSREYLAYIVDSTAAPICIIIPLSTWAVYVSGLFEDLGFAPSGQGLATYIQVIPFILYGWVALLVVLLSILGIIPKLGPMKKAEERAEKTGVCIPEGSEGISLVDVEVAETVDIGLTSDAPNSNKKKPKLMNFLIPIGVLIFYTWFSGIDLLAGVLVATAVTILMLAVQRLMGMQELFDAFFDGFKPMIYPLGIVVTSFILVDINDTLGLTEYVIETVQPLMSPALLPAVAFITLALVAFATGSFWGVYAITLPIIIPLSEAMGTNMWLAIGAVLSAGAFGSHACPYGDATVLSATGCGIDTMTHVITQMPYILLSAGISTALYLILGFVM